MASGSRDRCTVHFGQPLPPCAAAALELEMRQWTLRNKLHLLVTSPKNGIEQNVDLVWKVLQPQLLPELLHTGHYLDIQCIPDLDMGSTAVAAGLANLLPTLERLCPGLVDPTYTLVAAARHCDLAGLQAASGMLGQRLRSTLQQPDRYRKRAPELCEAPDFWNEVLAAAAGSTTSCAIAKMEWVPKTGRPSGTRTAQARVCGQAAASGDLARLQWLRQRGFPWGTGEALRAVLQHAEMRVVLQLEQEGGYLPPDGVVESDHEALACAARAPRTARPRSSGW